MSVATDSTGSVHITITGVEEGETRDWDAELDEQILKEKKLSKEKIVTEDKEQEEGIKRDEENKEKGTKEYEKGEKESEDGDGTESEPVKAADRKDVHSDEDDNNEDEIDFGNEYLEQLMGDISSTGYTKVIPCFRRLY